MTTLSELLDFVQKTPNTSFSIEVCENGTISISNHKMSKWIDTKIKATDLPKRAWFDTNKEKTTPKVELGEAKFFVLMEGFDEGSEGQIDFTDYRTK